MSGIQNEFIQLDCPRCGAPLQVEGEILTCQHCGARLIPKRAAASRQNAPAQAAAPEASGLPLSPFSYYEPQSGLEVFSILVPRGWKVSGGVTWVISRPAAPFQSSLQIYNPGGLEAFETFPALYFTWDNNPLTQMTKPTGSLHFGYEVCQPMAARDILRQFVLPRYRRIPGLEVAQEGQALELQQAVTQNKAAQAQGGQYSADSARVRLHYSHNNIPIAEELSGVAEYTRIYTPSLFGGSELILWGMDYLTSFRANRDQLESYAGLYRAMFGSIRINPSWTAFVQQVIQGLSSRTINHINQIGALSHQISRNYNEMSQMSMQGWQERSASADRVAENFSQTIRGVESYYDPNTGQNVELPSGYTQAWSTPLGDYVLTEDPNFNPNIHSNQTWTPLDPPKQ